MADVTLADIAAGVRSTWTAAGSSVTDTIPVARLYFKRLAETTVYPAAVFEFKDVSAYFGGTEYTSGAAYVKVTQVTFKVYFKANTDLAAFITAMNNALSWSSDNLAGSWTIPNATILGAMPEVEAFDLEEERVDGIDIARYETTFSVKMQANRG